MCVDLRDYNIYLNQIWYKHKYHTTNTTEWSNSHKLKIQDGGGLHLKFRKNLNNFGLHKDILHQIICEDALRPRGDDHVTKSRNRKLIRETSSNERSKYKLLISVTIADIWTKFYIELKHHTINMTDCSKFTWLENPRRWRSPSWISENVNNSELDRVICAKFGGQMHHGHPCADNTWPKLETGTFFAWRHCCDE